MHMLSCVRPASLTHQPAVRSLLCYPPSTLSQELQNQLKQQQPEFLDRCHFFNSFFYKRLHNAVGGMRRVDQSNPESLRSAYDAVKR